MRSPWHGKDREGKQKREAMCSGAVEWERLREDFKPVNYILQWQLEKQRSENHRIFLYKKNHGGRGDHKDRIRAKKNGFVSIALSPPFVKPLSAVLHHLPSFPLFTLFRTQRLYRGTSSVTLKDRIGERVLTFNRNSLPHSIQSE